MSELYKKRDSILKQLRNSFDTLEHDLLNNDLMYINCRIIKKSLERG